MKRKKYCLIMTSLVNNQILIRNPILYLGEWCKIFDDNANHSSKKNIAEYHWNNRDQLYEDYRYILKLYEHILSSLVEEFNKIHKTKKKERYWRIILGPWLLIFLAVIYDRWQILDKTINEYNVTDIYILKCRREDINSLTMEEFLQSIKSDNWNLQIFSDILKYRNDNNINFHKISGISTDFNKKNNNLSANKNKLDSIKNYLRNIDLGSRYVFCETYLSNIDNLFLQIKLKQFPNFPNFKQIEKIKKSDNFREWNLKFNYVKKNKFEYYIQELIPQIIPTNYLEGYDLINKEIKNTYDKKKRPEIIWTSNSYFLNDLFKVWCAKYVEKGSKLFIGQHGGHYGIGKFDLMENHEYKICDKYLSWGWSNNSQKIIPVGIFKNKKIKKFIKRSKLLLLLSGTSRYTTNLISMPLAGQWLKYFEDQKQFYYNLTNEIKKNSKVRLYPQDNGWFQRKRWTNYFPKTKFIQNNESYYKSLSYSKIVVSGWNSTTYLETLYNNIPTILFWDLKYFELRDEVLDIFKDMKRVGIFHDSPISAASHLNDKWEDIDDWWNEKDVLEIKKEFLFKFARNTNLTKILFQNFKF